MIQQRMILFLLALILTGCTPGQRDESGKGPEQSATIALVYVSNYPLEYFTRRIAGPLVDLRFPAASAPDPAYWNPAPEEIAGMQSADLIILNGASYEQWLKSVSLPASRMVETAKGFEDRWIPVAGTVTHSHGLQGEHEHAGTAFTTWLDMTLAVEQVHSIRDALVSRWPQHTSLFEDNTGKLEKDLLELDSELAGIVARAPSVPVIFSHPVYQYLQKRYGINGRSVHLEPDQMPDEEMWKETKQLKSRYKATWLIWEDAPLPDIIGQLSDNGIRSVVFDPCANIPGEGDFLDTMRKNVEAMTHVYGN